MTLFIIVQGFVLYFLIKPVPAEAVVRQEIKPVEKPLYIEPTSLTYEAKSNA